VFVQVSLHSAFHVNNTAGSEHSQYIKTDYLLVRASDFDSYEEASWETLINTKEPTVPVTGCIHEEHINKWP